MAGFEGDREYWAAQAHRRATTAAPILVALSELILAAVGRGVWGAELRDLIERNEAYFD
jgi:hypothetical protein